MADYEELKRLAEAAQFGLQLHGMGYIAMTVVSSDGVLKDWQAQRDVNAFAQAANPAAVLALIAENEAMQERLQIVDIVHGPKTERRRAAVLEQNCAEMAEALERAWADAERYRGVRRVANSQGYTDEQFDAQTDARIARFEKAMGNGGAENSSKVAETRASAGLEGGSEGGKGGRADG